MTNNRKKSGVLAFLLAVSMLGGCAVTTEVPTETEEQTEQTVQEEKREITELRPQDDLYGYVNLERLKTMEIEYGHSSIGAFDECAQIIRERMKSIILECAEDPESYPEGSPERLIGTLYDQLDNFEYASEDVFSDVFTKIDSISNIQEAADVMAWLTSEYGVMPFFSVYSEIDIYHPDKYGMILQGNTSLAGIGYEEMTKYNSAAIELKSYVQSFLKATGHDGDEVDSRADRLVEMIVDIALNSDYEYLKGDNIIECEKSVTMDELSDIFPSFDLMKYMGDIGIEDTSITLYTFDIPQLEKLGSLMNDDNLDAIKDYFKICFTDAYGYYLPESMQHFRQRYYNLPETNREKVYLNILDQSIPDQLGEVYAKHYADEDVIADVRAMCEELRSAYHGLIEDADWLTPETKKGLRQKLDNIGFNVGYPEPVGNDPKNEELIGDDLIHSVINVQSYTVGMGIENIGKDRSRAIVGMPPQTVNACYEPNNSVTIPIGIMLPPFYDTECSYAENMGSFGFVLAHEVSHAFDSTLIEFNENGEYAPDWICKEDREAFEVKMKQAEEYYSKFTVMDVYHVDGKLTLGENFADLGAMQCIIRTLSSDDEKKELFEGIAKTWCSLQNDTLALENLREDVHSPNVVRVNAAISACDEYYRIYDVKEDDGMYIAPEDRVTRW